MGIIIVPYLLVALILIVISATRISAQLVQDSFNNTNIIFGILLTLLIYGAVAFSYSLQKKAWALSPIFRFPFFMIFVPFFLTIFTRIDFGLDIVTRVSDTISISIISSGLFMVVFRKYIFNILDKLGVQKQY